MFSSRSVIWFQVLKLLVHFELIFVYDVRYGYSFILLLVVGHFPPLWRQSPTPHILGSFVVNYLTVYMWVYFWALCMVPLIYVSVLIIIAL